LVKKKGKSIFARQMNQINTYTKKNTKKPWRREGV